MMEAQKENMKVGFEGDYVSCVLDLRKKAVRPIIPLVLLILCWGCSEPTKESLPTITWTPMANPGSDNLFAVWGTSTSDITAVGNSERILHYDGSEWSEVYAGRGGVAYTSIWGTSASNIYVVGSWGEVVHYNGSAWSVVHDTQNTLLWDVHGTGPNSVFVAGNNGLIVYFNGTDWTAMDTGSNGNFGAILALATDKVLAAQRDSIFTYNGDSWTGVSLGKDYNLITDIWAASPNDVYAIGYHGTVLHYDGAEWTEIRGGMLETLSGIWGASSSDLYVVGWGGLILHFNGTLWETMLVNTDADLRGVWGADSQNVFVVGYTETILRSTFSVP